MSRRRNLQVARAVVNAIRYHHRARAGWFIRGLSLCWVSFRRMVLRRPVTPFGKWKRRLRRCRTCDLYDAVNRTCGHTRAGLPGEVPLYIEIEHPPGTSNLYLNGCSCLVGIKASHPETDCYAVTCGLYSRWAPPVSLDGKTEAPHPFDRS